MVSQEPRPWSRFRGRDLEAFTNRFGEYRLAGVPAGEATVQFFYTGVPSRLRAVTVNPGARETVEFTLGGAPSDDDPVGLDGLVVSVDRVTDARAIAINEQRFAPSLVGELLRCSLECYLNPSGVVSGGVFRKDFADFFGRRRSRRRRSC